MTLVKSPTELSTAATDLLLAVEGLICLFWIRQVPAGDRIRLLLGSAVFVLVFSASLMGAAAHGLEMRPADKSFLFALIFSALGIIPSLLALVSLADLWGWEAVSGWTLLLIFLTVVLLLIAHVFPKTLPLLLVYEALAYLMAWGIYTYLVVNGRGPGAGWIATTLLLGLIGALVQSRKFTVTFFFPLDQNGVFHLIAMAALAFLARGLRLGM